MTIEWIEESPRREGKRNGRRRRRRYTNRKKKRCEYRGERKRTRRMRGERMKKGVCEGQNEDEKRAQRPENANGRQWRIMTGEQRKNESALKE